MKVLITGVCGFVGSVLARALREHGVEEIVGVDNFSRPGSELNRQSLRQAGVRVLHADIRAASDLELLPPCDWVIDAAANASVVAGVGGGTAQLVENNLVGTLRLLECCRQWRAGFILLSTSRVYNVPALASIPVRPEGRRLVAAAAPAVVGLTPEGVAETFSTAAPVSLYGATKLASEVMALEYGQTFGLPVRINRCGVMAGAGQFGRPDQGIVAFWLNSVLRRRPLRYIGFGGHGWQVRDVFHPRDLAALLWRQLRQPEHAAPSILNFGGGQASSFSLAELTDWAEERFGERAAVTAAAESRAFDIPWFVMDSTAGRAAWDWAPAVGLPELLEEIAVHALAHPGWLELSAP